MREYELMWILPGTTTEDEGEKSIETVTGLITENGGDLKSASLWGRRSLSYPIKKNTEGAYYLARFSAEPSATSSINRAMDASQDVIRHLLVKEQRKKATADES